MVKKWHKLDSYLEMSCLGRLWAGEAVGLKFPLDRGVEEMNDLGDGDLRLLRWRSSLSGTVSMETAWRVEEESYGLPQSGNSIKGKLRVAQKEWMSAGERSKAV